MPPCAVILTGYLSKDQSAAAVYTRLRDDNGSYLRHVASRLHHAGLLQPLLLFPKEIVPEILVGQSQAVLMCVSALML